MTTTSSLSHLRALIRFDRVELFDRVQRAAVAMVVSIGVFWLVTLHDFRPEVPAAFGVYNDLLILGAVGIAIFLLRTRGFAFLWILLLLVHPWFYMRYTMDWWNHGIDPWSMEFVSWTLNDAIADWAPFALCLTAASLLALFRDGCVSRRAFGILMLLAVPLIALWLLQHRLGDDLFGGHLSLRPITQLLVGAGLPIALAVWHIRQAWICKPPPPVT